MVNSISRTIQNLIDGDLSLQDSLQRDYGNYSAIARMLKPKVEEILGRHVKLESLITSVKRAKTAYKPLRGKITEIVAGSVINIQTDVAKISIEKTKRNLEKIRKVLVDFPEEFFQVIEGMSAITLVFDQKFFDEICSMFMEKDVLDEKQNLATIIIRSPDDIIHIPGCVLAFYNTVSRRHINIEETMSCFTDTIIVLAMEDVSKAFAALTDLIAEARKH
jgi:acetolactate synthase small subunit